MVEVKKVGYAGAPDTLIALAEAVEIMYYPLEDRVVIILKEKRTGSSFSMTTLNSSPKKFSTLSVAGQRSKSGTNHRKTSKKCSEKTEVYSRIVGYYRPVQQWNVGKKEEYKDRKVYDQPEFEQVKEDT